MRSDRIERDENTPHAPKLFGFRNGSSCLSSAVNTSFPWPVSSWRLRPDAVQGEYGRSAPRVTRHPNMKSQISGGSGSAFSRSPRVAKDVLLAATLEELAQMCGALVRVTDVIQPNTSPAQAPLRIDVHVGDALDFCDALSAVPRTGGGANNDASTAQPSSAATPPIAFQQDTLRPLHLRAGTFGPGTTDFDVIKSSNLADHLGGRLEFARSSATSVSICNASSCRIHACPRKTQTMLCTCRFSAYPGACVCSPKYDAVWMTPLPLAPPHGHSLIC